MLRAPHSLEAPERPLVPYFIGCETVSFRIIDGKLFVLSACVYAYIYARARMRIRACACACVYAVHTRVRVCVRVCVGCDVSACCMVCAVWCEACDIWVYAYVHACARAYACVRALAFVSKPTI